MWGLRDMEDKMQSEATEDTWSYQRLVTLEIYKIFSFKESNWWVKDYLSFVSKRSLFLEVRKWRRDDLMNYSKENLCSEGSSFENRGLQKRTDQVETIYI